MNKDIIIKPTFQAKDYFKVNLYLYSKSNLIWILPVILISFIIKFFMEMKSDEYTTDHAFPYLQIIIFFIVILTAITMIIYFIYYSTKSKLAKNPRLKENIQFVFNEECFSEKGESFKIKHFWKDLIKIEEKEKWYLLFIEKTKAFVIRKEDFESKEKEISFRTLIESINIKKKLKK